jgi:hypothetical protein
MKCTLFLLAAMASAVCGIHLGAEIQGVTTIGDPCSEEVTAALYDECVVDEAIALGVPVTHTRRLELRGSRELQTTNHCGACQGHYEYPHWCVVMKCVPRFYRHLTIADENVHTERMLYTRGQIEQAANTCLDRKIEEGCKCLGHPEDLTIKILFSEE